MKTLLSSSSSSSSAMEQQDSPHFHSKIKASSSPSIARSLHPFLIRTSRFLSHFSSSSSTSCSSSSSSYPSSSSSSSRHEFSSILRFLNSWRCFSVDDVHFANARFSDNRIAKLSLLESESKNPTAQHVRVFSNFRSSENCKKTPDLNMPPRSDPNLKLLLEAELQEAVNQRTPESKNLGHREVGKEGIGKVKESMTEAKATRETKKVKNVMRDSVAKVQYTYDPCADFYESMREMVMEKGLTDLQQMEEMFACFVVLNSPKHHRHIQKAYTTLLSSYFHGKVFKLKPSSSSSHSFSSSSGYGYGPVRSCDLRS